MTIRHLLILSVVVLYSLFSSNVSAQNYTVLNDATIYSGCNCYRLTPAQNNQGGGVYQNNTINLNNSFDYIFNVFLGCNDAGADGIVFILTNNITSIGAQGGGLGYLGLSGNSLAIEYDTYQNSQDPSYDHIAIESQGSVSHNVAGPVPATASSSNIEDCAYHTTEIKWDVNTQTYSVYFDGVLRLSYTGNIISNFFQGNPIVNWGWSGSTGGGNNDQRFCVTSVSSWIAGTNYQSCATNVPFTDISTTNVGSVQSWAWNFGDPGSGAANTSALQNPTHTFSAPGTFTVTLNITDVTGCVTPYSHTVVINAPITLTPTITQPACNGDATGGISLATSGGFGAAAGYGGYQYTWSNGIHVSNETGVTSGTYNVSVTDGVCSATGSYTLNQPPALTASTSHTDASCGTNNGSVTMTITGGTQPYTGVNWNLVPAAGSGSGPYTRNNVPAAIYVADFHDANGCSALLTYRETVASLPCGYSVSTSSTDVTCFGGNNGTATLTVTGGTPTIVISWTNSGGTTVSNSANASNLVAGVYTYHYSDGAGQSFTGSVTVNQPGGAMVASLTTTNATCSYLNNGSAVASVTANGTPGYNYAWSPGAHANSATATGFGPGGVSVIITDSRGCTATASGTVTTQPALVAGAATVIDDSCYLSRTGSAVINPSGGTPPYTYQWNNSPTAIGNGNYGIGAGTYTVVITDHNGCTANGTATINQPASALTEVMSHTDISCFGASDGTATVNPAGGNGGYTYTWSPVAGATNSISSLGPNEYYVTVADSKNCRVSDSVAVVQPAAAFTATPTKVNVLCNGGSTGSINLNLAGGTTAYGAVTWTGSPGASGTNPTGLAAGTYNYSVADAKGCTASGSVTITQPASAFTAAPTKVDVLCNGSSTGSINLNLAGGNTAYGTVTWTGSAGASGTNPTGLAAGTYNYSVADANGCIASGSVTITQPAQPFTVIPAHTDVSCNGGASGTITLTLAGGTTAYGAVTWTGSPGASGTNPTGLAAGTYNYSVSDANACPASGSVTIAQPATAFTATPTKVNVLCNGGSTGSINLNLAGGTTAYGAVTWTGTPGASGTNPTGLAAGTYNYSVADANGCTASGSVTITQPASAFTATPTKVDVLCNGGSTGSINLNLAGGTTAYGAVTWTGTPGASGTNPTGLAAGTYNYSVSDANGCPASGSVTIGQPAQPFAASATKTDVSCNGGSDGTITLALSGGTTAYGAVTWTGSPGASGTNPTGLAAGTYNYSVSDANACPASGSVTIAQPATAFTATPTKVNVLCNGGSTGSINLNLAGGTTAYGAVTWTGTPGASGTNPTGLAAGTYNYSVADANGCTASGSVTITQPASAFTATPTKVDVLCNGGSTGSINLNLAGGTTAYGAVTWTGTPGASGTNPTGLAAGTYNYSVSDANGCPASGSVTIAQPAQPFAASATKTDVSCNGGADGTITLALSGGTTAYGTVTWTGTPGASGTNPTGLSAGTYNYSVSDANACPASGSVTIAQPATAFTATPTKVNVLCNGGSTGSINLNLAGGTTAYGAVTWTGTPGASGTNPTGLAAGTYNYSVADANGCTASGSVTITQPASAFTATPTKVDVLCNGGSTGSINLNLAGGTTAYGAVTWTGSPGASGTNPTGLAAGTYNYSVSDANGCPASGSVTIGQPAQPFAASATKTDVSCNGGADGTITLALSGGTTAYGAVTWTGTPGASGTNPTGLAAGTYNYSVTDANACPASGSVTIAQPAQPFTATPAHTDVSCNGGANGTITLTLAGGTTAYGAVTWTGTPGASGTNPTGLSAGTYNYSVADANACPVSGTVTITEPATVFAVGETHVDVACFGNNTGSITLSQSGGTPPYATPWWTDLATGTTRNNLIAGTYTYSDSDANGCIVTASITIQQPATGGMNVSITKVDASCSYSSDGQATASVAGGVSPYNYAWSNSFTENGVITSTATGLSAITYTVVVTDQNSCTAQGSVSIGSQPRITTQIAVVDVRCFGASTGSITLTASGGTGVLTYGWSANAATGNQPNAINLAAAAYQVTITDANGCVLDTFASVAQPVSALSFTGPVIRNVSCNGGNNGGIGYVPSGGTPPYSFTWSGSAAGSNDTAGHLIAGSYDVTISDANGCQVFNTAVVTEPSAIVIGSQAQTNVTCNGANDGTASLLNVTGGTPGGVYTYTWTPNVSSGSSASSLAPNTYSVVVADNNQCTVSASFTITEPQPILTPFTPTNVLCNNGSTGAITINPSGGTPASTGYVYVWTPNVSTTNTASSLTANSYSIVVSDSLGCSATQTVQITEPTPIVPIVVSTISVSCSRDSNGQIQLNASGGTPGYQYALSPDGINYSASNSTGLFTDLKIGNYTGRVTDLNGCTNTISTTISAPDSVTVTIVTDTVKCYGDNNGALTVTSTGGTPGYTYDFSGGINNTTGLDGSLIAGLYGVTVTDARGCAQTYTIDVPQPDSLEISVSPANPTVDLTQSLDLQANSNAATEVTYIWSPAEGLSNTVGSNTQVTTNNNMVYTLTGSINPHGKECKTSIQVPVAVVPNYDIFIPNTFTPNNDGINDEFEIYGNKRAIKFVEVTIFDRWGEKVFHSTDIDFKWDGKYNGTLLEPNTFVYQLSVVFIDNHAQPGYKGSLLLMR